ncbi:MAG: hypothetical protein K6F33_07785 [Bacteroidales bacterium]|nr:hypothetical protein [Bacteroidales bacterium]
MSYKIAIASSDSLNVDLHFGNASSFKIYTVEGLDFSLLEDRKVDCNTQTENCGKNCGQGDGNGCGNKEKSAAVEAISDCRAVVCAKIGRNILKQLESKAISTFDVEVTIDEALSKIVNYYYKIDNKKWKLTIDN